MHNILKATKIYQKLIFSPRGSGYIIHDRGVATLGHVTHGTSWLEVIHKENSTFLNQFFPTPYLYYELNMIIHTRYIHI